MPGQVQCFQLEKRAQRTVRQHFRLCLTNAAISACHCQESIWDLMELHPLPSTDNSVTPVPGSGIWPTINPLISPNAADGSDHCIVAEKIGGRDVAKTGLGTLSVVLAFLFLAAYTVAQTPRESLPGIAAPFAGSPLTCSSASPEKERIVVQAAFAAQAKLKSRLINLLHESLHDDAKGIVNIAREKEIKKLASKLKRD